jgi:hypothetical protein
MVRWSHGPMVQFLDQKKKKNLLFFPLNFVLSKFERTEFERTNNLGLYSKKQIFSFKTNFERTTDEFQKNLILSNDLSRFGIACGNLTRPAWAGFKTAEVGIAIIMCNIW